MTSNCFAATSPIARKPPLPRWSSGISNFVYRSALRKAGGEFPSGRGRHPDGVHHPGTRKAPSLTRHTALTGWLYTTTHFTMSEVLRSERRRQIREQRAQATHALSSNEVPEANWDGMRLVVDEAMQDLSRTDREAILLRFFDGLPFADVGVKLSLREDTARMRVARALERLRASFARRGIISTTAAMTSLLANEAGAAAPAGLAATVIGNALTSRTWRITKRIGLWHAFSAGKLTPVVAGILGFAVIGGAIYEWREAFDAQSRALAAGHQAYETGGGKPASFGASRTGARRRARNDMQRTFDGLRSAEIAAAPADGSWSAKSVDREEFLAAFPEARRIFADLYRSRTARDYAAFYRSAGLTPLQISQFEALMAETWLQNTTLTTEKFSGDISQPPETQMRDILGDDAYGQFRTYFKDTFARRFAGQVAAAVGYTGSPLTAEQAGGLAQLVADNSPTDENGRGLDPNSTDWDVVAARAKSSMSAAQWKAAEAVFAGAQFDRAFAEARNIQSGAHTTAPGASR